MRRSGITSRLAGGTSDELFVVRILDGATDLRTDIRCLLGKRFSDPRPRLLSIADRPPMRSKRNSPIPSPSIETTSGRIVGLDRHPDSFAAAIFKGVIP